MASECSDTLLVMRRRLTDNAAGRRSPGFSSAIALIDSVAWWMRASSGDDCATSGSIVVTILPGMYNQTRDANLSSPQALTLSNSGPLIPAWSASRLRRAPVAVD
jgi:hypothetical protein